MANNTPRIIDDRLGIVLPATLKTDALALAERRNVSISALVRDLLTRELRKEKS